MTEDPHAGSDTQDPALDLGAVDLRMVRADMHTTKGRMRFEFFPDKAPRTVRNFLDLTQKGFYDGLVFHRVIKSFMVQGGCPEGTGTGDPGYRIEAEFNDTPHERGVLSMARGQDPDSAGSQFFIVHGERCPHLDGQYTAFGRLVEGSEVLDELAAVETSFGVNGERSRPSEELRIERVSLSICDDADPVRDDADAPGGEDE